MKTNIEFVKATEDTFFNLRQAICIIADLHICKLPRNRKFEYYERIEKTLSILQHALLHHAGYLTWNPDGTWVIHEKKTVGRGKSVDWNGRFELVLKSVKNGENIEVAIKKHCKTTGTSNFYRNITKEQKQVLMRAKLSNAPYMGKQSRYSASQINSLLTNDEL